VSGILKNKNNGFLLVCSLHNPHIGYATLLQNALSFHDDTISNGFSSDVI